MTRLKLGPLELDFRPLERVVPTPAPGPATPVPENVIQAQKQEEEQALLAEEIRTKDQQLAELLLTDPAAYEKMLEDQDLVPETDATEGDDDGPNADG